jgi:hypothetical protein
VSTKTLQITKERHKGVEQTSFIDKEYVALTETNDVDQDWKIHGGTRVTQKDLLSDYPQLRLWKSFFPDTDVEDWMSMLFVSFGLS